MTQDFAKIRPEPLLEKKPAQSPPAWSMLFTGVFVGMALGVFGCVLLYLSGNVPPLTVAAAVPPPTVSAGDMAERAVEPENADNDLELEFYHELPNYEVPVDATPVEINDDPDAPLEVSYLLQSGAYQQQALAQREVERQQNLGLDVFLKPEMLTGRTLYLVQSGPYSTHGALDQAETTLRRNNINFIRISPR